MLQIILWAGQQRIPNQLFCTRYMAICDYKKKWPPIILEPFRYQGAEGLPATETIPDTWTIESGDFTTRSERYMEVLESGEIVYAGLLANDLSVYHTTNANYAAVARLYGKENLKFELRARRVDDSNYIAFYIDFEDNQVQLKSVTAGVETVLDTVSHIFDYEEISYYSIELWMFDSNLYGCINGSGVITGTSSSHITSDGFSLYVPEIYSADPITFAKFAVHDVLEISSLQLEGDPSNLMVQLRKSIMNRMCSPVKTYEEYIEMRKYYDQAKDLYMSDESWEDMGYYWKEPSVEDYLV